MVESVSAAATTVPEMFRTVVARSGQRCALEADDTRITFAELDRLSNRVAHGLLREKSDRPVALAAPLAPSSVILMLGALKAGRLFTPVDPRDPPERVQDVVSQLGARLIGSLEEISAERDDDPGVELSPQDSSLVYFTSGSTGQPCGVIRTHAQLCYPGIGHGIRGDDRVGLILPLAFSGSLATVFGPLITGATSCFFDPITRSLESLADWIVAANITLFQTAPTALTAIAQALDVAGRTAPSVRVVIIGGEPCRGEQLVVPRRVFPRAIIVNHYGSTEAGFLAVTRIAPGDVVQPGPVPCRTIYPDQILTIVDDDGLPVPPGEPGEILVSRSLNVALGFWGPPQDGDRLPVDEGNGRRSIQLRDRARLHPDGTLELLGRTDLHVKIHGQNVDLQSVERALDALPWVREAVVSAVPGAHGLLRLVAHVVPIDGRRSSPRDFRVALAAKLPPYAIPSAFLRADTIPRSARGKVDRAALRENAATMPAPVFEHVAARTAREQTIGELAAEALGLPEVGVRDDLFDLGLDSFVSAGLLAAIQERFGVALALADLLEAPTVERLAQRSEAEERPRDRVAVPTYTGGAGTPLFCVPGGGGAGTFATRRLGRRLGRPTYSFVFRGVESRALPDRTVPSVAARFVAGLRQTQPEGPYLIGGASFGGLLAFEMARQLHASGQQVALLVLIDPVTGWRWQFMKSLRRLRDERVGRAPNRGPLTRRLIRHFVNLTTDRYTAATAGVVRRELIGQGKAFFRLHVRMARRYAPQPYAGRALLLRTSEWQRYDERDISRSLSGKTRVETIPGTHKWTFAEPNLAKISAIIREELATLKQGG